MISKTVAILVATVVCIHPASAEDESPNPLSPDLVSEVTAIRPGEPFWIGLWLEHPEHYHTYWKAPGIVGIPTELDWTLPEGFTAGKMLYTVPKRVSMAGINAHGYHGNTLHMVKITPPDEIAGDSVLFPALASWMCCWKTCHPGFERISITLPVDRKAKNPLWDPKWHPVFVEARSKLPNPLVGWEVKATESDREVVFKIKPISAADPKPNPHAASVYFFCGDGQINSGSAQTISRSPDGTLTLTMKRSQFGPPDATSYPGLLYCEEGWLAGGKQRYGSITISRDDPKPPPNTKP